MCTGVEITAALTAAAPYIAAVGTGATIYGATQSSAAQSRAAAAVRDQNLATQTAQNQAFQQRMAATQDQSNSQFQTAQEENTARTTQAAATRSAQMAALQRQNTTVEAENQSADQLRAAADARAQELLSKTTGPTQDQSQQDAQTQAAALLAASQAPGPTGPAATNPDGSGASTSTNDPATKTALARRMGIAAANIRQYGADIARVASYGQPLQDTGQAITENKTAIMPEQAAAALLSGGSGVRLLPSQIAYRSATDYGAAADQAIQTKAQGENTYAGLAFGNTTGGANLGQSDTDTRAANEAAQAKADAQWQQQMGGLFAGIGNLGLYGAGRFGPAVLPGASGAVPFTANKITGDGTGGFT